MEELQVHTLLAFAICIFGSVFCESTRATSSLHVEAEALLSLKTSIVDISGRLASWTIIDKEGRLITENAHCNWVGVGCDRNFSVTSLNISSMGLSGSLLPAVGLFPSLINLSVAENHFSGLLPKEIASLSHLVYLNISNNNFSGIFPSGFANLKSLQVLDAFNNNFSGGLPLELSLLTSLRHLHLGGNYFSGHMPPQYGNMQSLEYLGLSGNALTGRIPAEFGSLSELRELYLGYYNELEGGIPVEIGRLSKLVRLDLSCSGLHGIIPAALGHLGNLDTLFLQKNGLTGSIPPQLGNIYSLKSLDLSCNSLTGSIPQELGKLQKLELLNLFENSIQGSIPSGIADLPNLQVLKLFTNKLTGVVPQHLGANGKLIIVDLALNLLGGPIPPQICMKQALEQLILMNNRFSGTIPETLAKCVKLTRVRLGNNKLHGSIPPSLFLLPALNYLELLGNELTGMIPGRIANLSMLGTLDLSYNQLTGSLPSSIGRLDQLINLVLAGNKLSGVIPHEVGSLQKLVKLDLSRNMLSGNIPPALGDCSSMTMLDLSHNQLDGEIPPVLSKLFILDTLNLSWNHFTGAIPQNFVSINTLVIVDFSFNNLSGLIPEGGKFSTLNGSSFVGNPGLCGKQLNGDCSQIDTSNAARLKRQKIIISICCLLVGLSCIAVIIAWCLRRVEVGVGWELILFEKLTFSLKDVVGCITEENIISKGGSAIVYKGLLPGNQVIAIKAISTNLKICTGVDNRLATEIRTLGCIRHRNIVRLLGFCTNNETSLLLLEYMPNGSLSDLLHGPRGVLLDWGLRYKIALDSAKGLCYLHHDHSPTIVHRDVKSSNILLDDNFEAHVADFGLAKVLRGSGTSESMTSIAGSYGYIAPEYAYTLRVDEKSDVYSYGVVLLELITGRRPTEPDYGDYTDIAGWVRRKARSSEDRREIMDARIQTIADSSLKIQQEFMLLLEVAIRCVSIQPDHRPTMHNVVQLLTHGCNASSENHHEQQTKRTKMLEP
ncbi:hypothetical protein KP509_22G056200 [Ceratopteris richardii]|uniref:non-specific serine/threonine protein kinase n=1 Tax=Ceratopteris richardii TaxID=49495 RepID=A0A8T2S8L0_CERRI|nr:hypothetical protein KP509_22G056200 [Ceratopteris richardii]